MNEFRFAGKNIRFIFFSYVKPVVAGLNNSVKNVVIVKRKYFEAVFICLPDWFPVRIPAYIFSCIFQELLPILNAASVMIEPKAAVYGIFQVAEITLIERTFEKDTVLDF